MSPLSAAEYFCEILDFAMPWPNGEAAVLAAYFDASERPSGVFSVGGIAFGADRAKKATRQWDQLWSDTRCHMTDWHSKKKEFADWDDAKTRKRLEDSIGIVASLATGFVSVSCDVPALQSFAPKSVPHALKTMQGGFASAYGLCCHFSMAVLGGSVKEGSDIAYFYEAGDEFQQQSQRFFDMLVKLPEAKRAYRHRSHTVLTKNDCRLFEPADMLAWEWAKHVERVKEGKPMRGSLRSLVGDGLVEADGFNLGSPRARCFHLDEEALSRVFKEACDFRLFEV